MCPSDMQGVEQEVEKEVAPQIRCGRKTASDQLSARLWSV